MRNWFKYLILFIVVVSCKKENAFDCFKSNGHYATQSRNVNGFQVIKVYDKIDVNIIKGSEYKVEVTAGEHIISNITTEVKDNELSIHNENRCNFVRGYKKRVTVNITLPYLRKIENNSVGTVRLENNFTQDSVFLRAENSGDIYLEGNVDYVRTSSHGNGDIYLSGNCKKLDVYMFGTNFLYGSGLRVSDHIFVETVSAGDCHICAPDNGILEYNLWRNGNIYYRGTPQQIINYSNGTGKGKLIQE